MVAAAGGRVAAWLAGWRERDTQVPSFLADSGTSTSHKAECGVSDQESRVFSATTHNHMRSLPAIQ